MNQILFSILASKPWIYGIFASVRKMAITGSSKITGVVLVLASLIVTFKLIKFAYELMSDEQGSGFGQISLKSVITPFLILMLIEGFPTVISVFDGVVDSVTLSMVSSLDGSDDQIVGAFSDKLNEKEEAIAAISENTTGSSESKENGFKRLINAGIDGFSAATPGGVVYKTAGKFIKKGVDMMIQANKSNKEATQLAYKGMAEEIKKETGEDYTNNVSDKQIEQRYEELYGEGSAAEVIKSAKQVLQTSVRASKRLRNGQSILMIVAVWLFKGFYYIMEAFAELFLCILALLGPIACMMSLFDITKDAWKQYFAKYAQVSLWKVIAAALMWIVTNTKSAAFTSILNACETSKAQIAAGNFDAITVEAAGTGGWITIIICIAGFMAMKNIPSMAASIIPANGGGSAMGGGEAAAVGAVGAAAAMPGRIAGGAKSVAQTVATGGASAATKATAATMQTMQKSMTQMSHAMTKMASSGGGGTTINFNRGGGGKPRYKGKK